MIIALFEDERCFDLLPLVYSRPVFGLRTGMKTIFERFESYFNDSRKILFVRDYLTEKVKAEYGRPVNETEEIDEDVLFLNGSLIIDHDLRDFMVSEASKDVVVTADKRVVSIHLHERKAVEFSEELEGKPLSRSILKDRDLKKVELTEAPLIRYPWDLVSMNSRLMKVDFQSSSLGGVRDGYLDPKALVYGCEDNLYLGKDSMVEGYVVLDVRNGPIYIGDCVEIYSPSRISGPAYIGSASRIYLAHIGGGSNIGYACRVGGEVSESILQGFVNKYHTGYVGHSYICEWVNVGAGTFISDLKNTYGTVKFQIGEKRVDSKLIKVGSLVGDHSKLSIGTQVYSGKIIGFCSHVHGFITENVPSFTIWAKSLGLKPVELNLDSAIETEKRVYARRGIKQTEVDIELLKRLFELTSEERLKAGVKKGNFKL